MDTKRTEIENLILKIKTQQEIIAAQTRVSSIDIDLQLDYIRAMYEHYLTLKQGLTSQKTVEEKFELSDCGTLPLFNSCTEEDKEIPFAENEMQGVESEENLADFGDFEKNDAEFFGDFDEEEETWEEETLTESRESENNFEEIEETEDEELGDESLEEEEEDDDEDNFDEIEEEEDEDLKDEYKVSTAFPTMEIEMNLPTSSGIDIDAIEFATDEDEYTHNEEITEKIVEKIAIPHIGTSEQPRYWGDELDIDPIPAKPTSIGDKYASTKPSLNEIVSGFKPDESIGMKLQHGSVSDLMKSIDMNLKFLFVKNLFKGNGSVFTEEINKINSIGKLHEAIKYVEEIKDKYNWDDKSEAYTELYKLVLRKYAR